MPPDWRNFIDDLRAKLVRESQISMTVDEIIAKSRCDDSAIRERWFWRAEQLGSKDYEDFTTAGVQLEFFPDRHGRDVESVTFFSR
ncbi:MAG: hypothetical protein HY290_17515 [Planctomycetia bacterium]|nr:hypothetical protein [Planctomycetia bacterium]